MLERVGGIHGAGEKQSAPAGIMMKGFQQGLDGGIVALCGCRSLAEQRLEDNGKLVPAIQCSSSEFLILPLVGDLWRGDKQDGESSFFLLVLLLQE